MDAGSQKVGTKTVELPSRDRNEVFDRTENPPYGDISSRKHKPQIKFVDHQELRKQEMPTNIFQGEPLKNGRHHQTGKHFEEELKAGEAFQRDYQSVYSDPIHTSKGKNIYNNEPPFRKATTTEVRGSESSLCSKVSTCSTLLNPVMENATESDTNEISQVSRESSPRESMDEALKSEKAFIEYVMSLPSSITLISKEAPGLDGASKSKQKQITPALTSATKVGLDHLDNLCKLMEQLSELKETNSKLQKRVQYLEDLKTLNDMHKEIRQDSQYGSENVLLRKKQMGLKKSMTSGDYVKKSPRGSEDFTVISGGGTGVHISGRDQKTSVHRGRPVNSSAYDGRRRERSKSVGHEDAFDGKSKRIFPKWSKVKEALGWERPLPEDSAKQQNYCSDLKEAASKPKSSVKSRENGSSSFFKGNRRVFTEDYVSNLGIPYYTDYTEKEDESPSDSIPVCDLWKNNLNFHSSSEDISRLVDAYRTGRGTFKRDSESSTKRISLLEPPSDAIKRQKSTPSPSSERCRTYHEMLDLKPKALTIERDIDAEQAFAKFDKEDGKKSHKSPWGRVKTIIERRRDSLKRRHFRRGPEPEHSSSMNAQDMEMSYTAHSVDDLDCQSNEGLYQRKSSDEHFLVNPSRSDSFHKNIQDDTECRRKCRPESIQWKEKEDYESNDRSASSALRCSKSAPNQGTSQFYDVIPGDGRCVSSGTGEYPTPSSSPQFHRKSRWLRMKNVLRGKKEEECGEPSSLSMPASPYGGNESTFDFEENEGLYDDGGEGKFVIGRDEEQRRRSRGQCRDVENCSREITRVGSDSYVHKLSLSSSAPITDIMLELQRNLSEDFNRKIVEWERIRSLGGARTTSPKWDRKNSELKPRSKKQDKSKSDRLEKAPKPKIKDLSWLEKELQKIEKEKLRLSKEKEKYEERAIRLERLRQTVLNANNTNKKEVLVRTSAGEFRFEGISDAFTKKLYEWETKRGVCPELSTIALLDSSLGTVSKPGFTIQQAEKCNLLHRALSRSESSLPEIGQPSHTSSNSLPSLKPPDTGDMERVHLQSRASSEPDLTSLSAIVNSASTNRNNGICVTPYENVSVVDVFPKEEGSRDSLSDVDKNPNEISTPTDVTHLIDSFTSEGVGDEERRDETETEQREENYYSLLEENVILLEQLKKKEDICRRLEKELELLDEKVDEMNSHHQNEMERYREKLWEMHRPGTTPREAQGCLQIISELRTRIEELEKCSERLRNDRDTIEDSFRYHSEQQDHMTLDLLSKMRELQAAGGNPISESAQADDSELKKSKRKLLPILDMKIVDKLQNLSTQLVKQTTDLENTLAERTRQICQLRWELLHRDVSTVKLETELHTAHIQGAQHPFRTKCDAKRSKYAHFRSWSSEEASSRTKQQEERYPEFDRLVHQSQEVYSHLPKSEFQATDLSCTVHELSRELLRLSTAAESLLTASENEDQQDKVTSAMTENAVQRIKLSESEAEKCEEECVPPVSAQSRCGFEGVMPERQRSDSVSSSQITVRRNSADNISSVSGPDVSETSSINEAAEKSLTSTAVRTLSPKHRVSSSSDEESSEEQKFKSVPFCTNKDRPMGKEMILKRIPSRKDQKRVNSMKDKSCNKSRSLDKRVTNSDSKIPLSSNFSIVKSGSVGSYDRGQKEAQPADRSLSIREKRELFANRREHVLRRRLKPSALEIKMVDISTERPRWDKDLSKPSNDNVQEKPITPIVNEIEIPKCLQRDSKSSGTSDSPSISNADKSSNIGNESSSLSVVTVKIPRRKPKTPPKKTQSRNSGRQDSSPKSETSHIPKTNVEATVTVVLPKKKRMVDRQLPKRSSTDGDIRELIKRQNIIAAQSSISPDKHASDDMCNLKGNNDTQLGKKCLTSSATGVKDLNVKSFQTDTPECLKTNIPNPTKELDVNSSFQTDTPECLKTDTPNRTKEPNANSSFQTDTPKCLKTDTPNPTKELNVNSSFQTDTPECSRTVTSDSTKDTSVNFFQTNTPECAKTGTSDQTKTEHIIDSLPIDVTDPKIDQALEPLIVPKNSRILNENISTKTESDTRQENHRPGYFKSPSAPQLNRKLGCARKISREGSPNVRGLIEKYNQKAMESQSPKSPRSAFQNSAIPVRKMSAVDWRGHQQKTNIPPTPMSSFPNSSAESSLSVFPDIGEMNSRLHSPPVSPPISPPTSPASKARADALLKAKENFMSSNVPLVESRVLAETDENRRSLESIATTSRDFETTKPISERVPPDDDRVSSCSTRSMDSTSLVVFRTGESCQESRLARRIDSERHKTDPLKTEENPPESISIPLMSKTVVAGYEFKLPSSLMNLKLRKSKRKKDLATVSELCRQSLLITKHDDAAEENISSEANKRIQSPRSCPSSPELKSKNKPKSSWLQWSILKHK